LRSSISVAAAYQRVRASLFIQNRIKAGAMRSGKNLIGKVRIELVPGHSFCECTIF
jgi:hypothetical protein